MNGIEQQLQQMAPQGQPQPSAGGPGYEQALMQRYQRNPQLTDLLALQKLKTEKEAAARSLSMSQSPEAGTIAEQREEEVLGLTKNEVVANAGKLLGAQQFQTPVQGQQPSPQMSGIASQPAPNIAKMAAGGIVGFAGGGLTKSQLEEFGLTQAQFDALSEEDKASYEKTARSNARYAGSLGRVMSGPAAMADLAMTLPRFLGNTADKVANSDMGKALGMTTPTETANPTPYDKFYQAALGMGSDTESPAETLAGSAPSARPVPASIPSVSYQRLSGEGGIAGIPDIVAPQVGSISAEQQALEASQRGVLGKNISRDPGAEGIAARDEAAKFLERSGKRDSSNARMEAFKAFEAENYSPEQERRDRLIASLTGGDPYTGIGGVLGGGARASQAVGAGQRASGLARLNEYNRMGEAGDSADTDMGRTSIGQQNIREGSVSQQVDGASRDITSRGEQERRALEAEADRKLTAMTNNQDKDVAVAKIEAMENDATQVRNLTSIDRLSKLEGEYVKAISELAVVLNATDRALIDATNASQDADSSDAERLRANEAIATRRAYNMALAEASRGNQGRQYLASIRARIAAIGGQNADSPANTGYFPPEDAVGVTKE